jgi:hypothetical protein
VPLNGDCLDIEVVDVNLNNEFLLIGLDSPGNYVFISVKLLSSPKSIVCFNDFKGGFLGGLAKPLATGV